MVAKFILFFCYFLIHLTHVSNAAPAQKTDEVSNGAIKGNVVRYAIDGYPWPPVKLLTDTSEMMVLKDILIKRAMSDRRPLEEIELGVTFWVRKNSSGYPLLTEVDLYSLSEKFYSQSGIEFTFENLKDPATRYPRYSSYPGRWAGSNPLSRFFYKEFHESDYYQFDIYGTAAELITKNGLSHLVHELHHFFLSPLLGFQLKPADEFFEWLETEKNRSGRNVRTLDGPVFKLYPSQISQDLLKSYYEEKRYARSSQSRILGGPAIRKFADYLEVRPLEAKNYLDPNVPILGKKSEQVNIEFNPKSSWLQGNSGCKNELKSTALN